MSNAGGIDERNRLRNVERAREQEHVDAPAKPAPKPTDPAYADVPLDPLFLANLTASKGAAAAEPSDTRIDVGLDALAHRNASHATGRPLSDYLKTLDGAGPKDLRPLTKALSIEKISSEDARSFAATGLLPPLRDANGAINSTGEERTRALYAAASQNGSWTAVNALTFLVGARRAVLQAEIASASGQPALAPQAEQARQLDKQLGHELQSVYARATVAREHTTRGTLAHASALEKQADADPKHAPELRAMAAKLRDRGAQQAYAEATYRAKMPKAGFDANASYAQAAQAQVDKGRAELQKPELSATPPESLSKSEKTANSVPGAARIVDEAKATTGKADPRLLQVDFNRGGVVADFHQRHLDRGGAPAHFDAKLEARHEQLTSSGALVESFGDPAKLTGERALEAARVRSERGQVIDELTFVIAKAEASDKQAAALVTRKRELDKASADSPDSAKAAVSEAREGSVRAEKEKQAVFGDAGKSHGAAKRDEQAVAGAGVILADAEGKASITGADAKRNDEDRKQIDSQLPQALRQARRDGQNAAKVRKLLDADPTIAPVGDREHISPHAALRRVTDAYAKVSGRLLDQAQKSPPHGEPAKGRFLADIGARKLDIARSEANATEIDEASLGPAAVKTALPRLAHANELLESADDIRLHLAKGGPERTALAQGVVDTRIGLAAVHADVRPAISVLQLDSAAMTARSDLPSDRAAAALTTIGSVAASCVVRSDVHFDQVLAAGGYDPDAQDALYARAHQLLDGNPNEAAKAGKATLRAIDKNLDASVGIVMAARAQVKEGAEVEVARTNAAGRSEIQVAQLKVSTLITGGVWLGTNGAVDLKEDMAEAGGKATAQRTGYIARDAKRLDEGASEVESAILTAKLDGHPFRTLGAIRIWSDRENGMRFPGAYAAARSVIHSDSKSTGDGLAWQGFLRTTVTGSVDVAPVARALGGPVVGFDAASSNYSDKFRGTATADMTGNYLSQLEGVKQNSEWLYPAMAVNLFGEIAVATLTTAGVGDLAVAGEAADGVNAARSASQALGGVRAAMTAARAAHPVMYAVGAGTAYGAGVMAASAATHRLFGEHSFVSAGFDVATNFIPIGAEQKGIHVVSDARKAAMGAERAVAASEHGVSALRGALSGERLLGYAKFYGPQIALAGGQAVVSSIAVPVLAEQLGVRSQLGQAAIGLVVNGMMAGGISAVQARGGRTRAEIETVGRALAAGESPAVAARVTADVEGFLKSTEGRIPTSAEIAAIRSRTLEHLGIPAEGGGASVIARREQVSAILEGVRVERVGAEVLGEIRGTSEAPLDARQSALAVERIAERLGGPSRVKAFHDALAVVQSDLATAPAGPEVLAAAEDRVRAAEIAGGFAAEPDNGMRPLLDSATKRTQVEKVLGEELGGLRAQVESSRGSSLTEGSPSAFQRVATRLEKEAGLDRPQAEAVLRAGQHDVVERASIARANRLQAQSDHPLTEAEVHTSLTASAERSGLPRNQAEAVGSEMTAREDVMNGIQGQLPPAQWPPDMRRDRFLRSVDPILNPTPYAELSKLTPADFAKIYPEGGPVPFALTQVGDVPGFAAFAHGNPNEARNLADAAALYTDPLTGSNPVRSELLGAGPAQMMAVAKRWEPRLPVVKPFPGHPDYVLVERGPASPSSIAMRNIRPAPVHDHNGAFHQLMMRGDPGTMIPNLVAPQADHMLVRVPGKPGLQPLSDANKVLIFSSHGMNTAAGETNQKSVSLVVEQIRADRASGQNTKYVVLEACHQRDRRGLFSDDSNAANFQRTLNQELKAQGLPEVTVLAADRGGPLWSGNKGTRQPVKGWSLKDENMAPARFVPADEGSRLYVTKDQAVAAGVVGGAAVVAAGITGTAAAVYYRPVEPKDESKKHE